MSIRGKRPLFLFALATGRSIILTSLCGRAFLVEGADTIQLGLPIQCRLGHTCWVANYVDVDPTDGARDFQCEPRTYNGHGGIDVALRDAVSMEQGVPVVASAPGIVHRVRDGKGDHLSSDAYDPLAIAGRECGNGVVINHPGGWQTQYCHLKQGSLRVKATESVDQGAVLGLVGRSGQTEFPHVHFTVRHHGQVVDPFTGRFPYCLCSFTGV